MSVFALIINKLIRQSILPEKSYIYLIIKYFRIFKINLKIIKKFFGDITFRILKNIIKFNKLKIKSLCPRLLFLNRAIVSEINVLK